VLHRTAMLVLLLSPACTAQSGKINFAARKDIDAGNQAWIDGMKQGRAAPIAATYALDALDWGPPGDCLKGRAAIGQSMKERFAKFGRALSASVTSRGAVQQGDFVYEWGHTPKRPSRRARRLPTTISPSGKGKRTAVGKPSATW
jgi:hypothetical protein